MAAGRPTDYSPEIITKAKDYLEGCVDEAYQLTKTDGEKSTSYENKIRVKLPTIEGLALYLKIHKDTVYEWEKMHEEFSDVIALLRSKQAEALINNGLSGDYNPTIAKVLLSKHGYKEEVKTETQHSGTITTYTGIEMVQPDAPKEV